LQQTRGSPNAYDPSNAKYYNIVETENDSNGYKEIHFYLTGEKESENTFINSSGKFVKNGKSLSWYINGQLKSESNYIKGELDGKESTYYENGQLKSEINDLDNQNERLIVTYWKNGKIKRRDFFRKEQLQTGVCFDSLGNEIKHFDYEVMPQYKGGDQRLINDIANNLEYPIKSRDAGIQGRVLVRFVVSTDGSITSVSILEGVSPELNAEAIRVVKTLKKFKPGLQDGEPVPVFYGVPISFNLR
jgi:TonB family protein